MIIEIPDLKLRNPYIAIAIEEVLAEYYKNSSDFDALLRFWLNPSTIVLGRTCKVMENVNLDTLLDIHNGKNNVYLTRRLSGGGTVYHSNGNLNYTIIIPLNKYPEFRSIKHSYNIILNMIVNALKKQGIIAEISGLSDLVLKMDDDFKKFSGNSQFRKFNMLTHHGTLILSEQVIKEISQILKHPPKEPEYRKKRNHNDFLVALPKHFDISLFYSCLLEELKKYLKISQSRYIMPQEFKEMRKILIHKVKKVYKNPKWIYEGIYTLKEVMIDR